jgi:lysophospholipase L1-like esterase
MLATGVVFGQALIARRVIPAAEQPPPRCDGRYGCDFEGEPIRLALLGDSSAAGYGVDAPRKTIGALLATGLAEQVRRPVDLRCVAVVGAQSRHLSLQMARMNGFAPDLAVILIGGNDVTHRQNVPGAVRALGDAVRALRAADIDVVVGTCPDLGAIQPDPAAAEVAGPAGGAGRWPRCRPIAVVEAGGRTVSLGDLLGPQFAAEPERMFAWDRFHPSEDGYVAAAAPCSRRSSRRSWSRPARARPTPDGAGVRSLYAAAAYRGRAHGHRSGARPHWPAASVVPGPVGTPAAAGLAVRRAPDGPRARTLGAGGSS